MNMQDAAHTPVWEHPVWEHGESHTVALKIATGPVKLDCPCGVHVYVAVAIHVHVHAYYACVGVCCTGNGVS